MCDKVHFVLWFQYDEKEKKNANKLLLCRALAHFFFYFLYGRKNQIITVFACHNQNIDTTMRHRRSRTWKKTVLTQWRKKKHEERQTRNDCVPFKNSRFLPDTKHTIHNGPHSKRHIRTQHCGVVWCGYYAWKLDDFINVRRIGKKCIRKGLVLCKQIIYSISFGMVALMVCNGYGVLSMSLCMYLFCAVLSKWQTKHMFCVGGSFVFFHLQFK